MRVVCLHFDQPAPIAAVAEVFYRATPQIMVRGERSLFLEIAKCRGLYSEATFLRRARATLRRLNLNPVLTVASDVPTAFSLAVFRGACRESLPIEALKIYADPLGEDPLVQKKMNEGVAALRRLGVVTVGDYARLPAREISSRLGSVGMMAFLRVTGQAAIVWRAFVPCETVREREEFDLESPADNLEPILFRLRAALDRVHLRLRGRGRRAKSLQIILRQEHALKLEERDVEVGIYLQMPYASAKTVFQIVKEKLEAEVRERPFRHRIAEITVTCSEDVPYFMNQKDLFDQKKEENDESYFALIARLATRLGEKQVFFASPRESHLPEKTWQRVSESKVLDFKDHLPERPARLLPKPEMLQVRGQELVADSFSDHIEELEDHEVVLTYWWAGETERVYYKLRTRAGRRLWVYRNSQGYFLHGFFD